MLDQLSFKVSYFRYKRKNISLVLLNSCSTPSLPINLLFFFYKLLQNTSFQINVFHCNALYLLNELCYDSVCITHAHRYIPHLRELVFLSYLIFFFLALVIIKYNFLFEYWSVNIEVVIENVIS